MNKSLLISLLITTFSILSLQAQDSKFGLKAGINMVSFTGDDSKQLEDTESGFLVGIIYDYIYTDRIGIQLDFIYSQIKAVNGQNNDSSLNIGYLDIPIVFKYYFNQNINLHVGPQFSLLSNVTYGNANDASDLFKIGRTSAVLGAEYKFNMGLIINLRYTYGLTSILEDYEEYQGITLTKNSFDAKYNATQISIGYIF